MDESEAGIVNQGPILDLVSSGWGEFLRETPSPDEVAMLRKHERTGRPLGEPTFVGQVENLLGRSLRRNKPGRKPSVHE